MPWKWCCKHSSGQNGRTEFGKLRLPGSSHSDQFCLHRFTRWVDSRVLWCQMHRYYGAALGCTDYQHLDIIPAYSYDMHHICECKQTYRKKESWNMNVHIQQVRYQMVSVTIFSKFHKIHYHILATTRRYNLIDISTWLCVNKCWSKARTIIGNEGVLGLWSRGLKTRILANGDLAGIDRDMTSEVSRNYG